MKMKNVTNNFEDIYANAERISTRDFFRNYSKYQKKIDNNKGIIVTKQNRDQFVILPVPKKEKKGKYTLKDILNLRFTSGEKDLSKQIDKIVYGL